MAELAHVLIQLDHPTDPRFMLVDELPEEVTWDDVVNWRYGKPLLFALGAIDAVYVQPEGPGTPWMKPSPG